MIEIRIIDLAIWVALMIICVNLCTWNVSCLLSASWFYRRTSTRSSGRISRLYFGKFGLTTVYIHLQKSLDERNFLHYILSMRSTGICTVSEELFCNCALDSGYCYNNLKIEEFTRHRDRMFALFLVICRSLRFKFHFHLWYRIGSTWRFFKKLYFACLSRNMRT